MKTLLASLLFVAAFAATAAAAPVAFDIKPYFASIDAVPEATVGWHKAEHVP